MVSTHAMVARGNKGRGDCELPQFSCYKRMGHIASLYMALLTRWSMSSNLRSWNQSFFDKDIQNI